MPRTCTICCHACRPQPCASAAPADRSRTRISPASVRLKNMARAVSHWSKSRDCAPQRTAISPSAAHAMSNSHTRASVTPYWSAICPCLKNRSSLTPGFARSARKLFLKFSWDFKIQPSFWGSSIRRRNYISISIWRAFTRARGPARRYSARPLDSLTAARKLRGQAWGPFHASDIRYYRTLIFVQRRECAPRKPTAMAKSGGCLPPRVGRYTST